MINFYYETKFELENSENVNAWVDALIQNENFKLGEISYIFCDDDYLADINVRYLKHNTLTDIVSFDTSVGKLVNGDIYISIPRVQENATLFNVSFRDELHRVAAHGVLHFCGYRDKDKEDQRLMREKEDYYLSLRTF